MEWRTIPGFPRYQISERGDVIGARGFLMRGCVNSRGYRYISLIDDAGKHRMIGVHRLVCLTFHGDPPTPKHYAAHKNDIKLDNDRFNIYWATPSQNVADALRNGRTSYGEAHPLSRVTVQQVLAIRAAYSGALGQRADLARQFGLSHRQITRIVTRKSWVAVAPNSHEIPR